MARTTIWIGDIQWRIRNGIYARPEPILGKLDAIEGRDALVTKGADGRLPRHHGRTPNSSSAIRRSSASG